MRQLSKSALGVALAVALSLLIISGQARTVAAAALCVSPDGSGGCYTSIQAAVNAANSGDTISVAPGTYQESVTISTPLTLVGAGADSTTIDAAGADNAVHISTDGVWLQGFTIKGSRLDGVLVNGKDATIMNNTITQNASLVIPPAPGAPAPSAWNGLNLQNSSNDLVMNNSVSDNFGRGIRLEGSADYEFPDQGISLTVTGQSNNNLILDNTVDGNHAACGIVASTDSSDNVIAGNTVTNNPAGIVISSLPPFGLPNTPFASQVPSSNGNVISGNTVQNNTGVGINIDAVVGSDNNSVVANNTVSGNASSQESNGKTVGIQVNGANGAQVDGTVVMGNAVSNQDVAQWVVPNGSATHTVGIAQPAASSSNSEAPAGS
jgi:parallel beta-helix repeat protein